MQNTENDILLDKKEQVIFLIGFMGCGKSTLGKELAKITGYPFFDLDELISRKVDMDIPGYFATHGENAFREEEKEVLRQLADIKNGIVATGGGAPCHGGNMEWMNKKGITIYLQMNSRALLSRLSQTERERRPLLNGKNKEQLLNFINKKLIEREPYYRQATIIFDALGATSKDLLKELA